MNVPGIISGITYDRPYAFEAVDNPDDHTGNLIFNLASATLSASATIPINLFAGRWQHKTECCATIEILSERELAAVCLND